MTTTFIRWYRRFMILVLVLGIGDVVVLIGHHLIDHTPVTGLFWRALFSGMIVIAIAGSSLLKIKQLTALDKKPD